MVLRKFFNSIFLLSAMAATFFATSLVANETPARWTPQKNKVLHPVTYENFACLALYLDEQLSSGQNVEEIVRDWSNPAEFAQRWWDAAAVDILAQKGLYEQLESYEKHKDFKKQLDIEKQFIRFFALRPCRPNVIEALRQIVLADRPTPETVQPLSSWRRNAIKTLFALIKDPFPEEQLFDGYNFLLAFLWIQNKNPLALLPSLEQELQSLDGSESAELKRRDRALTQIIISYCLMANDPIVRREPDFHLTSESQLSILAGAHDTMFNRSFKQQDEQFFYFVQNALGGTKDSLQSFFPNVKLSTIPRSSSHEAAVDFLAALPTPSAETLAKLVASDLLISSRAASIISIQHSDVQIDENTPDFFGAIVLPLSEKGRNFYQIPPSIEGQLIEGTMENSPSFQWGLYNGDVIVEVDGKPLVDVNETVYELEPELAAPTRRISIKIFREGRYLTIPITPKHLPLRPTAVTTTVSATPTAATLPTEKASTSKPISQPTATTSEPVTKQPWFYILLFVLFMGGRYIGQKDLEDQATNPGPDADTTASSTSDTTNASVTAPGSRASMSIMTNQKSLEEFFSPRYRDLKQIGKGGMGLVYRARDTHIQRDVALKVISPLLVEDKEVKRRFLREVRALATLEHTGIVRVFDFGQNELPFYTMELVEGRPLKELIDDDELTGMYKNIGKLMAELAIILAHAHEQGVVHRDIKPSNVILRKDGSLKLIDFGVAAVEGSTTITQSQAVVGTPAYFAPEVINGSAATAAADQYSFGKLLYILVGGSKSSEAAGSAFLGPPQPIREVAPECPEALAAVIERCMSPRPADRFPSMLEVATAIKVAV